MENRFFSAHTQKARDQNVAAEVFGELIRKYMPAQNTAAAEKFFGSRTSDKGKCPKKKDKARMKKVNQIEDMSSHWRKQSYNPSNNPTNGKKQQARERKGKKQTAKKKNKKQTSKDDKQTAQQANGPNDQQTSKDENQTSEDDKQTAKQANGSKIGNCKILYVQRAWRAGRV